MLLQDAKDFFTKLGEDQALEKLCKKLENLKTKEDDLVVFIFESDLRARKNIAFNNSLSKYLFEQKYYKELYLSLFQLELSDLGVSEINIMLETLYEMGRLKEFYDKSKQVNEFLLTTKSYVLYEAFIKNFEDRLSKRDFFKMGKLLFLVEMNNVEKINLFVTEHLPDLFDGQVEVGYIEAIYNLLEQIEVDSYKHHKNKLYYKFLLKILGKYEVLEKDIADLILMSDKKEDLFLVYECAEDLVFKNTLLLYLKETYKLKLKEIPVVFKKLRSEWEGRITISKLRIENKKREEIVIKPEELLTRAPIHKLNEIKYNLVEEETKLLKQIKIEGIHASVDLIVGYIKLNFFTVADFLLDQIPESSNRYYLKAIVNTGKNNYSAAIDFSNQALEKYKLSNVEAVPFEYIKAEAFEYLSDLESARKCLERIAQVDPAFRNTEEKLLR